MVNMQKQFGEFGAFGVHVVATSAPEFTADARLQHGSGTPIGDPAYRLSGVEHVS